MAKKTPMNARPVPRSGWAITSSMATGWCVSAVLVGLILFAVRKPRLLPSKSQAVFESLLEGLRELFEPIVGKVHQPPPVHQTFQGDGFVICSFCPRPYDFHPEAIPAPYNHSNVDSDEVLFYASSEFMSRKGIEYGSITHHPDGIPHGPHPGRYEASIGQTHTNELAVMMDSFRPLKVAREFVGFEDEKYQFSWLEGGDGFTPPTS